MRKISYFKVGHASPLLAIALLSAPNLLIHMGAHITSAQMTTALSNVSATQPASQPTTFPTSAPALTAELDAQVTRLLSELGDRDYQMRESAQKKLSELGEKILPVLVRHLDDKNPEVAQRVAELIVRPQNPVIRVDIAFTLLATSDPDLMERAVTMLFESPLEDYDLFVQRTAETKGLQRAVCDVVADQLRLWKQATEIAQRQYERHRETKPDAAARTLKMHKESRVYQIEAAYWGAVEAMQDYLGEGENAAPTVDAPTTAPS